MKIQPFDINPHTVRVPNRTDFAKPVVKSRLRKLFDRPFASVLKISSPEKTISGEANGKDGGTEFEPSSVCLAKMVQNFIEESNERQASSVVATKFNRNRCNCFNATGNDSSDDEFDDSDVFGESVPSGPSDHDISGMLMLKSFIPEESVAERNLLTEATDILENNKFHKQKDDLRKILFNGLSSLGYDSSICKSKWKKSSYFPPGEYEYIDVIVDGERFLIDVDFRSEFEIARSTATYKAILESLPYTFVGKPDRLSQVVSVVSEAAKVSLKKKGMPLPPWRKAEYMRAKWLSPHTRTTKPKPHQNYQPATETSCGDYDSISVDETTPSGSEPDSTASTKSDFSPSPSPRQNSMVKEKTCTWQLPAIKPKSFERRPKILAGLASILSEQP